MTQHAAVARSDEPESLGRSEITWSISSFQNLVRAFHAWTEYAQWGSWARRAAALAKQVIEPGIHQAIITSGPPHMAHEAGRLASRASGLPLVLDMRDPWSLVQRLHNDLASPLWYWFAERYEGRAVGQASIVAMNTEPSRRMMQRRYHNARERFITVMNGCDDEPLPPSRHGKKFLLAYTGAIYLDRDPTLLFRAAAGVVRELRLTPDEFGLEFMGHVASYGSRTVMDMAKDEGLDGYLTLVGRSPRHIVMDLLARATMLVSLPQDSDTAIPAKIFEYVQFDAWLLALATPDSAVALLLQNTGAEVVQPDDLDGMTTVIRKHVVEYRNGIRPTRPVRDDRFSRRTQAQRLLNAIAAIVRTEPAAREPASLSTLVTR